MQSDGFGSSGSASLWHGFDALAFSSVLAAGVAGALTGAVGQALDLPQNPFVLMLATSGTLVVYNIDRLRDLERDRTLAPLRSAFIERFRRSLGVLVGCAAAVCAVSAVNLPPAVSGVCAGVFTLGLLHRRLKRIRGIKTAYLATSWLGVVVGLPLAAHGSGDWPTAARIYWIAAIVGCGVLSNLMASNLDRRGADEDPRHAALRRRLGPAIAVAGLGMGSALVGPEPLRGLLLIPAAEFLAVTQFREGERYGPIVVDGALLTGALCAIAFHVMTSS